MKGVPNPPEVVSRDKWRVARIALLEKEKELTRRRDELNAERRRLPMVEIDKDYTFEGPDGRVRLVDMFDGCRQLIAQHFMFDPEWDDGCPSCTLAVDELAAATIEHLRRRDTAFALVSRAPFAKLADYKQRRGWSVPWFSSYGSDFNYDFHVTIDADIAPVEVNYKSLDELGEDWKGYSGEQPGKSCFLRDGVTVFHTYHSSGRGQELPNNHGYLNLDLTALGRQEDWEQPAGRTDNPRPPDPSMPF